jgi:hypothetical protein
MANLRALARQPWPEVEYLSFAFGYESNLDCSLDELAALIITAFPKLAILDLTRNEPTPAGANFEVGARHHAGPLQVFELVARWPGGLRRLRLPSLRHERDVARVQAALDRMPGLEAVDVVRSYRSSPCVLEHPTAAITIAPSSPWPPEDEVQNRLELEVELPGRDPCRLRLQRMIALMEAGYPHLEKAERSAWDRLWPLIDELGQPAAVAEIEASVLYRAIDVVDLLQDLARFHALHIQDDDLQHLLLALEPIAKSKQSLVLRTAMAY